LFEFHEKSASSPIPDGNPQDQSRQSFAIVRRLARTTEPHAAGYGPTRIVSGAVTAVPAVHPYERPESN
jgi:hypothetical protein